MQLSVGEIQGLAQQRGPRVNRNFIQILRIPDKPDVIKEIIAVLGLHQEVDEDPRLRVCEAYTFLIAEDEQPLRGPAFDQLVERNHGVVPVVLVQKRKAKGNSVSRTVGFEKYSQPFYEPGVFRVIPGMHAIV